MASPDQLLQCLRKAVPHDPSSDAPSLVDPLSTPHLWTDAVTPANLFYAEGNDPYAVVYPNDEDQAAAAIRCASLASVPVVTRSGYRDSPYSSGGSILLESEENEAGPSAPRRPERSLVVDMERFDEIEYLAERKRVKVGAGAQMGAVVQRLATQGRTLAGGFEPRRGVGEALAGEFGMTVRMHGLFLDLVVEAEVILADGTILQTSRTEHPDLFWAIRPAYRSLAAVSSLTLSTIPLPPAVSFFSVAVSPITAGTTDHELNPALGLLERFHWLADEGYADLGSDSFEQRETLLRWREQLRQSSAGEPIGTRDDVEETEGKGWGVHVSFEGWLLGTKDKAETHVRRTVDALNDVGIAGITSKVEQMTYLEALRRLGPERAWDLIGNGRQPADERAGRVWSYTKTTVPRHEVRRSMFAAHLEHLRNQLPGPEVAHPTIQWDVSAYTVGGLLSNLHHSTFTPREHSAFPLRSAFIVWNFEVRRTDLADAESGGTLADRRQAAKRVEAMAEPFGKDYQIWPSLPNPMVPAGEVPSAIYGSVYADLQDVKQTYDPHDTFRYPQSVQLPDGTSSKVLSDGDPPAVAHDAVHAADHWSWSTNLFFVLAFLAAVWAVRQFARRILSARPALLSGRSGRRGMIRVSKRGRQD